MRVEITMPRMGQSMEEGRIQRWIKMPGEFINLGDVLAEIETDKAVVEMESRSSGILAEHCVPEGTTVPIGTVIAVIEDGEPENLTPSPTKIDKPEVENLSKATIPPNNVSDIPTESQAVINASPIAKKMAADAGIDITRIIGTGPAGRIGKEDVEKFIGQNKPLLAPVNNTERIKASPLARKMADQHHINLENIRGTGTGGMITKVDVESAMMQIKQVISPDTSKPAIKKDKLSKNRITSGQRLLKSKVSIPHFYVSMDVEMDRALDLYKSQKSKSRDVSINDLVAWACVLALVDFPHLNSSLQNGELILHENIDLAIAVALPSGDLVTPVIQACQNLNLLEFSSLSRELIERARANRLKEEDLSEGNFTISNLGMFGVRDFSAIINPPHAAILAVGAIRRVPVYDELYRLIPSNQMTLTLSANHQITDGVEVAKFLSRIKEILEDGYALLSN